MSGELEEVQNELEETKQNLMTAAQFGKMLLEEKEELTDRIDELRKINDKKLELAEQERHGLQSKLDQKATMEAWFNEEISHLKQQLSEGEDNLRTTLEGEKMQEVSRLTHQIDELRSDLDQARHMETQLCQKNVELEALLQSRLDQTEVTGSRSFGTSEEVSVLQEEVNNLQCEVTSLKSQIIDKKSENQTVTIEIESLRGRLQSRDEELENLNCQFTSINNALEQVRVEKLDLNCQLDALRMETSGHNKKGNSIFSELDDRRVDAEKKLISLNLSNESLREKYNVEKQQNQKYKRQISQLLLQMSSGRVDGDYVANIESKLTLAQQQVKTLTMERAQLLEKQQVETKVMSELGHTTTTAGSEDYVQYLVTLIDGKEQELQKLSQELSYKTLQLLDEKSRTSSQDSKLVQLESEKDKLRSHNMKLALKVEELRLKYEPDSIKKSGVLVVKRTEKIPLDVQEEIKITETSRLHDNTTINQSQTTLHQERRQANLLIEKVENVPIKSSMSKCLKTKTVSISDNIEEHEIENLSNDTETMETKSHNKQKGKRMTNIQHISHDKKARDVNDCKSQ